MKFLVLKLNGLQRYFEYEFLPCDAKDEFVRGLLPRAGLAYRRTIRPRVPAFRDRWARAVSDEMAAYDSKQRSMPNRLILVTLGRLDDNYFTMREQGVSILALGDWRRRMAPPSLVEFILTLIVRESVAAICPPLSGTVHLSTRGCLMDFAASLDDVRMKVLQSFVCNECRQCLARDGLRDLGDQLERMLDNRWMGGPSEPGSPAAIASKLGHNLFVTKGLRPTLSETLVSTLQQEGVKQLLTIIGGAVAAVLLLWLGLKQSGK